MAGVLQPLTCWSQRCEAPRGPGRSPGCPPAWRRFRCARTEGACTQARARPAGSRSATPSTLWGPRKRARAAEPAARTAPSLQGRDTSDPRRTERQDFPRLSPLHFNTRMLKSCSLGWIFTGSLWSFAPVVKSVWIKTSQNKCTIYTHLAFSAVNVCVIQYSLTANQICFYWGVPGFKRTFLNTSVTFMESWNVSANVMSHPKEKDMAIASKRFFCKFQWKILL